MQGTIMLSELWKETNCDMIKTDEPIAHEFTGKKRHHKILGTTNVKTNNALVTIITKVRFCDRCVIDELMHKLNKYN